MSSSRLSPMDALFYLLDSEEEPQNIGIAAEFAGTFSYRDFVDTLSARMHLMPRYRQRVVPVPLNIGLPVWEDDPTFNIESHVFEHRLDAPGTQVQLLELGQTLFQGTLDHGKPLWEIHLIQGFDGGRTAMVTKSHHCMVDGVGGVGLLQLVFDVTPEPAVYPQKPFRPTPGRNKAEHLFDAVWDNAIDGISQWTRLQHSFTNYASDKSGPQFKDAIKEFGGTLRQFLKPLSPMPFNQPFSGKRLFAVAETSFAEARQLRTLSGGTINDVVLTVLGGAVQKFLAESDRLGGATELRVLCPVNTRKPEAHGELGNQITFLPIQVPLGDMAPITRLQAITETTRRLKEARVAEAAAMLLGLIEAAPPIIFQTLLGGLSNASVKNLLDRLGAGGAPANVYCTNVPGPQIPLYTCGQRLARYFPLAPINLEVGLSCAVTSYDQRLFFSLIADGNCVPDLNDFHASFLASFDELRRSTSVSAHEYLPLHTNGRGGVAQVAGAPAR